MPCALCVGWLGLGGALGNLWWDKRWHFAAESVANRSGGGSRCSLCSQYPSTFANHISKVISLQALSLLVVPVAVLSRSLMPAALALSPKF